MDAYRATIDETADMLADRVRDLRQPYSGASLAELRDLVDGVDLDTPLGSTGAALHEVGKLYLDHAIWFHEPTYLAHLNCPVALPAISAELLLAAVNTSVDTWDQSATGTLIERRMIDWTTARIGFGPTADGVFTSGGTQSNLHGLLLAREAALAGSTDRAADLPRLRILATTESHFSVGKSAGVLGLARDAVVPVATDGTGRMDPEALVDTVEELRDSGLLPMAVVATAGTTDLGCVDPLRAIGVACRHQRVWLHVDAAYGCGLLVSRRRRHLIDGIELADSVTVDFHKSFFQPVSSSAILVADGSTMRRIAVHADYLNPRTATVPNQVDKSLQTTRRFDALKLWMTLRTMGADQLGEMFDTVVDRAQETFRRLTADPDFEVAAVPTLSTVLFRYRPPWLTADDCDRLMPRLRARLFDSGVAIIAGTTLGRHYWLKFTLLNPDTNGEHIRSVLELIRRTARDLLDEEWDCDPAIEPATVAAGGA
ncbi:aspartate aminotransferase family protein [Solwaraspora sp. WMMD1047]|uniref:pyridoxal phosphate-dependent decarboxylase family protein n=1 Tax=Solwaraspora sp. WMMD1047 TaxID=3016102 RepID=UPI002415D1C1|nr:aspartate aminotransferase family protein [Solwaraspora sp. WMMD1047]MDG4834426.1 aspartate aminotransferase family protein [Solwaraspora sp. WMMD1047]